MPVQQNNIGDFLADLKYGSKELHFIFLLLITLKLDAACFKAFCDSKACSELVPIMDPLNLGASQKAGTVILEEYIPSSCHNQHDIN